MALARQHQPLSVGLGLAASAFVCGPGILALASPFGFGPWWPQPLRWPVMALTSLHGSVVALASFIQPMEALALRLLPHGALT